MKRFSIIFKYLRGYKTNIILYFLFIILSIVFSGVSLATLPTFLKLLFGLDQANLHKPEWAWTTTAIYENIKYFLSDVISKQGKMAALVYICITIIIAVFL